MREFASKDLDNPANFFNSYTTKHAEMEVESAADAQQGETSRGGGATQANGGGFFATNGPVSASKQSGFNFNLGSTSSDDSISRRRMAAPTSIPDFPSNNQPRDQPFSPSPSKSPPGGMFPIKSPVITPPASHTLGSLPAPPFQHGGGGGMQSPWLALAASSGAPTPSLDGPGRNSPQLGSPFERLNIGGSWSGANLTDRRGSLEPPSGNALSASPGKSSLGTSSGFSFGGAMDLATKSKSMDNAKRDRDQPMSVDLPEPGPSTTKPPLPASLAARRASLPKNPMNIHGSSATKATSPLAPMSKPASSSSQRPQPLAASSLKPILSNPGTLVLDLRPPSSYQASHLPESHSLPIPSTLLRRPAFTIQKLTAMLSATSMEAVSHWREKQDIVMIDQDSASVPDGSLMDGLAGKFAREGFGGHLWFVKGGHGAVRSSGATLVQSGEEEPAAPATKGPTGGGLMAGGMARRAFQQDSTGGGPASPTSTMRIGGSSASGSATPGFQMRLDPFESLHGSATKTTRGSSLSKSSGSYRGHSDMGDSAQQGSSLQPANPFFDNIRQNLELSHGGITERIPLALPDELHTRASELPEFLSTLAKMSEKDASDLLAKHFYEVELAEQKRLQAVMNWHTQDSGAMTIDKQARQDRGQKSKDREEVDRLAAWGAAQVEGQQSPSSEYYPFSITAGVERGTKNRYKNIWPYDFSRVRLGSPEDDSDYINASFIQPRGTTRRYIASQGPMEATFRDFWTLIWEQDVRVIAMITKQFEGGSVKCGNYWEAKQYGPLHVTQISQTGGDDKTQRANTGFDFGMAAATPETKEAAVSHIKRVFQVTNDDHPEAEPRQIVQIQCVSWPDFDVPESADVLLSLIREVDDAFCDMYGSERNQDRQDEPPVLVHCSAGVGRTGSFIVVDAILDGLRRERNLSTISQGLPPVPESGSTEPHEEPRPPTSRHSSGNRSDMYPLSNSDVVGATIPEGDEEAEPSKPMSLSHANMSTHQRQSFMKHRGDSHSISTAPTDHDNDHHSYTSSELKSFKNIASEHPSDRSKGRDQPIFGTASGKRHREASPICEMDNPVLEVLEGMRVQRMSLVQSLRQFVFVHKAIMTAYIQLLDAENGNGTTTSRSRTTSDPTTISSTSEDDTHSKRPASPTELPHDANAGFDFGFGDAAKNGGGASLAKRPSFKKMRSSAVEGISPAPGGSRHSSPKKGGSKSDLSDRRQSSVG